MSGQATGMPIEDLLALFERKMVTADGKRLSADAVSKKANRRDAIRNLKRKAKGALKGGVTVDTVVDIARALEITPVELGYALMGSKIDPLEAERAAILAQKSALDRALVRIDAERAEQDPQPIRPRPKRKKRPPTAA